MPPLTDPLPDISLPIREHDELHQLNDQNGAPLIERLTGTGAGVTAQGAIRDFNFFKYLHCGHPSTHPIGGKCTVPKCPNVSCKQCYEGSRCQICFAGCCLEHRHEIQCDNSVCVVCPRCRDHIRRQQRNRAVLRFLLKPFIKFDKYD